MYLLAAILITINSAEYRLLCQFLYAFCHRCDDYTDVMTMRDCYNVMQLNWTSKVALLKLRIRNACFVHILRFCFCDSQVYTTAVDNHDVSFAICLLRQ